MDGIDGMAGHGNDGIQLRRIPFIHLLQSTSNSSSLNQIVKTLFESLISCTARQRRAHSVCPTLSALVETRAREV